MAETLLNELPMHPGSEIPMSDDLWIDRNAIEAAADEAMVERREQVRALWEEMHAAEACADA